MYYIHQTRKDDCGFASLKMLLASLNKDSRYLFLKETKLEGSYSFKELCSLAKEHKVTLTGYRVKSLSCLSEINQKNLPFLLTIKSGKGKHLVLAKKVIGNLFFIKDPSNGIYLILKKKLEKMMEGTILVASEYKKRAYEMYFPVLLKKSQYAALIFLRLMCALLIICSTIFIDKAFPLIVSLSFLLSGLIFEVIYRILALRLFGKLDKIINDQVVVYENKYYDYYSYLQKYKSLFLNNITALLFSFTITVFISYLLVANEILNFIPLFFTIAYVLVVNICFKHIFKRNAYELENEEYKLTFSKNMEDYKNKIVSINNRAKRISMFESLLNLLYFFLLILCLGLNMYIRQTIDITYVIFYFFVFYFFKKCLSDICAYNDNKEKEKEYKVRLINLTNYNNDFECK